MTDNSDESDMGNVQPIVDHRTTPQTHLRHCLPMKQMMTKPMQSVKDPLTNGNILNGCVLMNRCWIHNLIQCTSIYIYGVCKKKVTVCYKTLSSKEIHIIVTAIYYVQH